MRFSSCLLLFFGITTGCIQSHRTPPVVYYVPVSPPLTPTSESSAPRVYAPDPAPEVPAADLALAEAVRHLLNDDPHLAGASGNVLATVRNSVVTLRGTVPSDHDHTEIVERISKIPGVVQVVDHLGLSDER